MHVDGVVAKSDELPCAASRVRCQLKARQKPWTAGHRTGWRKDRETGGTSVEPAGLSASLKDPTGPPSTCSSVGEDLPATTLASSPLCLRGTSQSKVRCVSRHVHDLGTGPPSQMHPRPAHLYWPSHADHCKEPAETSSSPRGDPSCRTAHSHFGLRPSSTLSWPAPPPFPCACREPPLLYFVLTCGAHALRQGAARLCRQRKGWEFVPVLS
ncbi:hypothetical protein VTK73DRAFT_1031 [Phialemonium thermophilum]|uniref:Uncharacterized protein n=1 Tax=Phialemonium thermophilum TaxID=223376 RepID=A0ABR3VU56_9PEZI